MDREPTSKDEYERRYMENHQITGFGIEGVTNHFPCPFCAAPDWDVVRVIDFSPPPTEGTHSCEPITCSSCGRSAQYSATREADGSLSMTMVQTGGKDAPEWVPIRRVQR